MPISTDTLSNKGRNIPIMKHKQRSKKQRETFIGVVVLVMYVEQGENFK